MDDPLGVQHPHGPCYLLQKHPDGVLAKGALSCGREGDRGREVEVGVRDTGERVTGAPGRERETGRESETGRSRQLIQRRINIYLTNQT